MHHISDLLARSGSGSGGGTGSGGSNQSVAEAAALALKLAAQREVEIAHAQKLLSQAESAHQQNKSQLTAWEERLKQWGIKLTESAAAAAAQRTATERDRERNSSKTATIQQKRKELDESMDALNAARLKFQTDQLDSERLWKSRAEQLVIRDRQLSAAASALSEREKLLESRKTGLESDYDRKQSESAAQNKRLQSQLQSTVRPTPPPPTGAAASRAHPINRSRVGLMYVEY